MRQFDIQCFYFIFMFTFFFAILWAEYNLITLVTCNCLKHWPVTLFISLYQSSRLSICLSVEKDIAHRERIWFSFIVKILNIYPLKEIAKTEKYHQKYLSFTQCYLWRRKKKNSSFLPQHISSFIMPLKAWIFLFQKNTNYNNNLKKTHTWDKLSN